MILLELTDREGVSRLINREQITSVYQVKPHLGTRETVVVFNKDQEFICPNPLYKVKHWLGMGVDHDRG